MTATRTKRTTKTAIEDSSFPFESLSAIAELESWRKEVNRPIYHIHKWWAQRLGSVFRAIVISAFSPPGTDIVAAFYERRRQSNKVIFDPFMGSGTTVGEAVKLGFRAIGQDINPVSHFLVKNALTAHSRTAILREFDAIEADTASSIRRYYRTPTEAEVLYYFWVKVVPCPACHANVDLFGRYVFSQNAYPKRVPLARAVCPRCGGINETRFDADSITCSSCASTFDPQHGPAHGTTAQCAACDERFAIAKTVKAMGRPPEHRMYAKMVLLPSGDKQYQRIDSHDIALFAEAVAALADRHDPYPNVEIEPGYNTNQALNYNYTHWHLMFNARQLLCISMLSDRIRRIEEPRTRELFACLLTGCLEFNNMFASFKGEGTGAVRHMFSHHILKPERTPLEANIWGTPKSSGAFSTLFKSRILRALNYQEAPFEIRPMRLNGRVTGEKVFDVSARIECDIATTYAEFENGKQPYLACGNSADTDLPDQSVDAVITDPPFFDNVHYSQLADFFHVWQRHILGASDSHSTRSVHEVQHSDAAEFEDRLGAVWKECCRVLKDSGLLVFTYHHSRHDGWRSVLSALLSSGFVIVAVHPIKSEMSVATPKVQAKEPIDYDVIVVCRKGKRKAGRLPIPFESILASAIEDAGEQISRLRRVDRPMSRNDVQVILMAHVIRQLSDRFVTSDDPIREYAAQLDQAVRELYG